MNICGTVVLFISLLPWLFLAKSLVTEIQLILMISHSDQLVFHKEPFNVHLRGRTRFAELARRQLMGILDPVCLKL